MICSQVLIFPFSLIKSLNSGSHLHYFVCFNESHLKMMENAFYFSLKTLFAQRFVFTFLSCRKNGLIRKIRLISKFMTCNLVNIQLQFTYCPIFEEVKANKRLNLVRLYNRTRKYKFRKESFRK